mmetsp:Transcript_29824/g.87015  ORF Transcript_29824/g.87015 Transcript_29824/m.87015 type:complete len:250 (+) Transcript_29824:122-871(+)
MVVIAGAILIRSSCGGHSSDRRPASRLQTVHAGRAHARLHRREDRPRPASRSVEGQVDHTVGGRVSLLHAGDATSAVGGGAIVNGPVQQGLDALPVDKVAGIEGQAQAEAVAHKDAPKFPHVLRAVDVIGRYVKAQGQRHGDEDDSAKGVKYLDGEGDAMALVLIVEHARQGEGRTGRVDVDGVGRSVDEKLEGFFFDYQFLSDGGVVSAAAAVVVVVAAGCGGGRCVLIGRHCRRYVGTGRCHSSGGR